MLSSYRKKEIDWDTYESMYLDLIKERDVASKLRPEEYESACLLCSEDTAHMCHRRLLAEHLASRWENVKIVHL
jgi:uncharacterized protein (DUF488 family)